MKRLRIWIDSFSLIQQFMTICFFTIALFLLFFFGFLSNNIDTFVDNQMYDYLNRAQETFIINKDNNAYDDTNVVHFVYSSTGKIYLNNVSNEYATILKEIDPLDNNGNNRGSFEIGGNTLVFATKSYSDGNYILVSLIKIAYREQTRSALLNSVVNITLFVIIGLFMFFAIWVVSLINPLNQIRNFINKIKYGENATLNIKRRDEIGEVAIAVKEMNEELSHQKRIREEMIQNISHDLKTPIATIKSYSESIKDGIYPYDTLEKSVDVIIEHANRLEKKVYSLLTLNKVGYLEDSDSETLMSDVIPKVIMSLNLFRNDVEIITNIDDNIYFHGEEEPWRIVTENLLDNALRYAKSKVEINLKKNLLEVFNDGSNMSKERIEKLFKPYEKGNKGNFGLGLSIVKRVADTYGYIVSGENMNDGVIFRVYCLKSPRRVKRKDK